MKVFIIYDDFDDNFIGDEVLHRNKKLPRCFSSLYSAKEYIKIYMTDNGKMTRYDDIHVEYRDKNNEYHTFHILETTLI